MQIGHCREMVYQVNRQAARKQPVPPRPNRNVLVGDWAAERRRILPCIEMHVFGLWPGQVVDLADVRLCGLARSAATTRATSFTATGEVLPSLNGSLI